MKKTSTVVFLIVFLFSVGSLPAHAQAQAQAQHTSFAYIPLISPKGGTSLPAVFRARQAFEILAPQLLDAQAKGKIVRFEPDFAFGFVKVEYRSGFDVASALAVVPGAKLQVFDNPKAVLGYTHVRQNLRSPKIGITDASGWVSIPVYGSCFDAGDMGADNYYKAYLWDTTGRLVASTDGYADDDGWIYDCFGGIWTSMVPGYHFSLHTYADIGTPLLQDYSSSIATLNISSINIKTKVFTGIGPANNQLYFYMDHPEWDAGDNYTDTDVAVIASSKGTWSVKLGSSVAVRGGDYVEIDWETSNFDFYRIAFAPFAYCGLGRNYCGVYGAPGKSAKVSVVHAKKTYSAKGNFSVTGYFSASFLDAAWKPVFLAAGDKVTATGVKPWLLPSVTAQPDYVNDWVTGVAPANRYFLVEAEIYDYSGEYWDWDVRYVGSDAAGNYLADFSSYFDIMPTDKVEIYVIYYDPITGNETVYMNYIDP